MCGIAGWIDWQTDLTTRKKVLENMTRKLSARGPDAEGYWLTERAAIGHRRLVVVDPEGGQQPMIKRYGERIYVLTYNGELYNTDEVREKLIAKGHRFLSYSDTEVVLVSYIEWGPACVQYLNGIFAFGIWSEYDQSLFLARDRMGVKPLFYTERGESFLFASEIKALLANPLIKPEIDREGLAEIFGLGPARTPGNGVFKGISELKPGYWMIYTRDGVKIERYWELESKPHLDNLETTISRVRELVLDAIERQLVSDVPVCTFLSGGLDSSIISAVAARKYEDEGKEPLSTFTIDYRDNEQYFQSSDFQPNSDRPWAERMAEYLKSRSNQVIIDNPQLMEALFPSTIARDLPGMADVDSSLFLFCHEIKKQATVALSGECADEIFGGYPWFHRPETVSADTFPWSLSIDLRNQILAPGLKENLKLADYVNSKYQETLSDVPRLTGEDPVETRRRELFYLNLNWFMALLLERKDRMSMASGLEVRVPFCDHRIVEYVWNIPWKWKIIGDREKGILREASKGILPDDVLFRKKSPFPKTHHPEYCRIVSGKLRQILDNKVSPIRQLVNLPWVKELIETKTLSRPWFGQLMSGPQLLAYLVQVNYWLETYQINILI